MANDSDDEKQIQKAEFRTEKKQRKTAPRRDSGRRIELIIGRGKPSIMLLM